MEPITIIQDRKELQSIKVRKVLLAFFYVPQVGANQPTPWLGLTERISIYGNQLWQVVLSIVLLREEKRAGASR